MARRSFSGSAPRARSAGSRRARAPPTRRGPATRGVLSRRGIPRHSGGRRYPDRPSLFLSGLEGCGRIGGGGHGRAVAAAAQRQIEREQRRRLLGFGLSQHVGCRQTSALGGVERGELGTTGAMRVGEERKGG